MKKARLATVFLLTFLAYAAIHSMREGWSYSKSQMADQFDIDRSYFGMVDTIYLVSYSVGMATIGNLSKRISLPIFVGIGMTLAAMCYVSFSIYYKITGTYNYILVTIMMCFNGFFQCTAWPGIVGIFGNWFGKGRRGLLMGLWAINSNTGNIIALLLCNLLQSAEVSWAYNFILTACFCIFIAILVISIIRQNPPQKDIRQSLIKGASKSHEPPIQVDRAQLSSKSVQQTLPQKNINVFTALCLPRVPFYIVGYACLKGCIYGLLFWLPEYLEQKDETLGDQKGYISSMVDVGSLIGGLIIGLLSDLSDYRAIFLSPLLVVSAGTMFVISFVLDKTLWTYYVALCVIGITIGGPYNIIRTVITVDLGQQTGRKNIAIVSSLIEGSAAIFAAVSQYAISVMPFQTIFYLFCGECIIAALALFPLFIGQIKKLKGNRTNLVEEEQYTGQKQ